MRNNTLFFHITVLLIALLFVSCRHDESILLPEVVPTTQPEVAPTTQPEYTNITGFYLLNEGNMGSNKATLDYMDYGEGKYHRNIFAKANPSQVKEMGDVGNDLGIYGNKLWCVINCSNKIDVLDKNTAVKVGQVDVPNCRFIKFSGGYAYVTSYAGPVTIDPDYKQRGYVAKIDTATLQVVDTCVVGFQPDGLDIVNGKIYVANSGGYMVPNYENTLSVIDLASFKQEKRLPVAINLNLVMSDHHGVLWISSRGDYYSVPSKLYAYDTRKQQLVDSLDVRVGNMWLDGDSLYIVASEWSYVTMSNTPSYTIVDVATHQVVTRNFITDGTDKSIKMPYGIAVNALTKDIYVTDARDYVTPGRLYCFGRDGVKKWDVRTGDIPAHFAFLGENINEQ